MNRLLVLRRCLYTTKRGMSTGSPPTTPAAPPVPEQSPRNMSPRYHPSDFDKMILVWTKKFKSRDEVPTFVSADIIQRSRSQARIKISNILIVLTALASFGAILAGKAAAKRGDSVHQMNLDWHKKYQDEQKAKEAAAAK